MSDLTPFNASRVTERLLVGGGLTGADEIAWLQAQGVTHIISCAAELSDFFLAQTSGMAFLHIPWADDGNKKDVADFRAALAFLLTADLRGAQTGHLSGVYVHCAAGVHRGPLMATFLLAALAGLPVDEAFRLVQAARPVAASFGVAAYRQSVVNALAELMPLNAPTDLPVAVVEVVEAVEASVKAKK